MTSSVSTNGRSVSLSPGNRVILFGSYDRQDGKWLFWPTDVFNVAGDIVTDELPAIEPYRETFPRTMTIEDFSNRVRTLASRLDSARTP